MNEGVLDQEINEIQIVLIPKVKDRVTDYRPVSLCNVSMRIITKVLANRLKEYLPDMNSVHQSAFVKNRLM